MSVDTTTPTVEALAKSLEVLCSPLADLLRALAQERDALVERSRWNICEEGDDLLICRGDHHRAEKCEWERYVPATERDAARAEVERWKRAAVLAALPLEAMKLAGTVQMHSPEVAQNIEDGIAAVRAALAAKGEA